MGIEKIIGVIGASYDNSGSDMYAKTREKYEKEVNELKREFPGHYILRNSSDKEFNLKFVYLVAGVPAIERSLISSLYSEEINRWVIVSHRNTKKILDKHCEVFAEEINKRDKEYIFVDEGKPEEWSLLNTIKRGTLAERVLFITGDLPFFYDIDSVANDPDLEDCDAILDLNSYENINQGSKSKQGPFPRYYHFQVKGEDGKIYSLKEPNVFLFKKSKIAEGVIEDIFKYRKRSMGGLKKYFAIKAKGNLGKVIALALRKEKIALTKELAYFPFYMTKRAVLQALGKKASYPPPILHMDSVSEFFSICTNAKIKLKIEHNDIGRLEDIDSMEDWALLNELALNHPATYPYYEELEEFRKHAMPDLKKEIEMYRNWPEFLNQECRLMKMPEQYVNGRFVMNLSQFDEQRVEDLYELHKRFNESVEQRE